MHVLSLTSSLIFRFLFLISTIPISSAKPITSHPQTLPRHRHRELSTDYYSKKCPQLESLVGSVTSQRFKEAPVSAPATIRLFFHDCFVEVIFYQTLNLAFSWLRTIAKYSEYNAHFYVTNWNWHCHISMYDASSHYTSVIVAKSKHIQSGK